MGQEVVAATEHDHLAVSPVRAAEAPRRLPYRVGAEEVRAVHHGRRPPHFARKSLRTERCDAAVGAAVAEGGRTAACRYASSPRSGL